MPNRTAYKVTFCSCRKSAVWWENPETGKIAVYGWDKYSVSLIGIHNLLLTVPIEGHDLSQKHIYQQLIDSTPDSYLFKRYNSLVVRLRPGNTGDSKFVGPDVFDQVMQMEVNK